MASPREIRVAAPRSVLRAALLLAIVPASGFAADWPAFEPGQWRFERTMEDAGDELRKIDRTVCIDPTADQAEQRRKLTGAGCEFSELDASGTTFRYTAVCRIAGMTSRSSSVLEAESAEAFTLTVESDTDGVKSREVMTARRVGACER